MNLNKFETIRAVNFLKGIIVNFDKNQKDDLILKFLEQHKELLPIFEQCQVLTYGLRTNEHTKQLTQLFVNSNYSVNNDFNSSFVAFQNGRFKTTKIILENGYDLNHEHNGKIIVEKALDSIHIKTGASTIKKVNGVLNDFDLDKISYKKFIELSKGIVKAKTQLLIMKNMAPGIAHPLLEEFSVFEKKYEIVQSKKTFEQQLSINEPVVKKSTFKI